MTLRGEVLRLQSEVQNIQEKAIQAVQVVQLLDKDGLNNGLNQNKKLSGKNLTHTQSQPKLQSQQSQSKLKSQSSNQEEKIHQPDDQDSEIVIELTIEPDEEDEETEKEIEQKRVNSHNIIEKEEPNEKIAETEVDLMLQQSIINLKLDEKNIGSLSPVVEDRLLRNIYQHYALESTGYVTLSR